jgi:hypothetical protein
MASTWSNLGLNLQGTGDNSGTWGQLTNVNLQDIDYAISGVAAITVTGNTTLAFTTNSSSTTYSNETGRAKIIVLSGSLSATTITITVPNIQKDYVIINNSGATTTITAGGSTTVSVATATKAYVYSNGSSSVNFALSQATNPGGSDTYVQYNSSGAFAGSSNLTFNGTTLGIQTATALNLTVTSLTVTNATTTSLAFTTATGGTATLTTANITTANVTTANVTSLVYVNATGTTGNIANVNVITNGTLKLYNTANTFYTGLKVAAAAATTATFTLPSTDGTANQVMKTDGSGNLSFATVSGGAAWQAVQSTSFSATVKYGYFVNTTSVAITCTLPASPTIGDFISFIDYNGTFQTNNFTVSRNGNPIQGSATDLTVATQRAGFTLVYVDSTQGWLLQNN